jgi:hypothetical protein
MRFENNYKSQLFLKKSCLAPKLIKKTLRQNM